VLPPHDTGIIKEVRGVNGIGAVNFKAKEYLIDYIDDKVEQAYFKKLNEIILSKEEIKKASNLKVVYTSIHGTGITMVPKALKELGFANVLIVEEQAVPDGNFPTVHSPNPEERDALNLALQLAEKENADMLFGTDPDADRVGIAVRNDKHELILLNGNQTGSLLVYYQISQRKNRNLLIGNEYVAKTIVTTDLIEDIAKSFNIPWYDTLTGFKYIAGVMREKEGKEFFRKRTEREIDEYEAKGGTIPIKKASILVIDEASMISDALWEILMDMKRIKRFS
jgi:phosphoglucomutase